MPATQAVLYGLAGWPQKNASLLRTSTAIQYIQRATFNKYSEFSFMRLKMYYIEFRDIQARFSLAI